ncbi:MAG: 2-oxoacid:acceptor oxidoreductase subunit alpha [Candidatus Gracilibacteria bacterium]|nr:2-oxoacid:acceptor oxidoreductase subunit alpha [Candidatus Gracilibacteria bacterium]
MKDITFCVGGPAGQGIKTVGFNFGKVMLRLGYYVHDNDEYPSLIKGGHNVLWARAADEKIHSHDSKTHILLALDKNTVRKYQDQMESGGVIIVDEKKIKLKDEDKTREDLHYISLPLFKTAVEVAGNAIMFNTVGLAAAFAMLGVDIEIYKQVLADQFASKGADIVSGNQAAAQAGYDLGKKFKPHKDWDFPAQERGDDKAYFLTGNQAITYGAVAAGCKLLCSYPMTPASSVMEFFGDLENSHNVVLKHVEDEIAALNMTTGAWHAGARAMVATSGGGFVLMAEALGFAAISEAGPVIFIAMRPGPATGVPTFTGQADLRFVLHAGQDEFPRIILAPGDNEECFYLMQEAFNLGDVYQTPVIVLSDKFLAESHFTTPALDDQRVPIKKGKVTFDQLPEDYVRYQVDVKDGVSTRAIPGTKGGCFLANSYEHDEHGFATEEADMVLKQRDKRHQKIAAIASELPMPALIGPEKAGLTLVTWGSTKMVAREAMRALESEGVSVNILHFSCLFPLDWEKLKNELAKYPKTLFIEGNGEGQFQGILKQYTDFVPTDAYHRIDGRPFYPEELVEKVREML